MGDFAENLRALMARHGWNQKQAADAIGVRQSNVGRWLSNESEPSMRVLVKIADAFGVPLDQLVRRSCSGVDRPRAQYNVAPDFARWFLQLHLRWKKYPAQ